MKHGQDYAQQSRLVICTPDGTLRYGAHIHYVHRRWVQTWFSPYVPISLHPKFALFGFSNTSKFGGIYIWMANQEHPIQATTLNMVLYLFNK